MHMDESICMYVCTCMSVCTYARAHTHTYTCMDPFFFLFLANATLVRALLLSTQTKTRLLVSLFNDTSDSAYVLSLFRHCAPWDYIIMC